MTEDELLSQHAEPPSKNRELEAEAARSREEVGADVIHEMEILILSDAVFNDLRTMKKAIELVYPYLQRERRRKKRSWQFQGLLREVFQPTSPVDISVFIGFRELLVSMRKQREGEELPSDTPQKTLAMFENLLKTRKEPQYWREYQAFRQQKKSMAEIIREFHPEYDQLHAWERQKYFRKVYNAIQRLVDKYGGPPLPPDQLQS